MKMTFKILRNSLLTSIKASVAWIRSNVEFLIILIYIISGVVYGINYDNMTLETFIFFGIYTLCIIGFIKVCANYKIHSSAYHLPIVKNRFTKQDGDKVYIEKDKLSEAILYLNSVEDYLENIGDK